MPILYTRKIRTKCSNWTCNAGSTLLESVLSSSFLFLGSAATIAGIALVFRTCSWTDRATANMQWFSCFKVGFGVLLLFKNEYSSHYTSQRSNLLVQYKYSISKAEDDGVWSLGPGRAHSNAQPASRGRRSQPRGWKKKISDNNICRVDFWEQYLLWIGFCLPLIQR